MLEKPPLPDQQILTRLQDEYGLQVTRLTFLPIGADVNTAVYRVWSAGGTAYFLKLRKGVFADMSLAVPMYLKAQGIQAILAPLATRTQQWWASLDAYKMVLYPFIEGKNGFEMALTDQQWRVFGAALKDIHATQLPPALQNLVPREDYSPRWRKMVKRFQAQVEDTAFDDPAAAKLAAFMRARQEEINHIVARAEDLGLALQAKSLDDVLCHADIHAGNLLLGADDALYIIDWDDLIYAPKERDLMFIGGGVGGVWHSPREEALFFDGYHRGDGQTAVDRVALAYYRYERIVQDIAAFCEQLLLTHEGGDDREQAYQYFTDQFSPNDVVAIAYQTDPF